MTLSEAVIRSGRHLSFQMKHRQGALKLDAVFDLTQPWTVLFGPSGSGKSTILRAIAGLMRPEQAKITLRGHDGAEQVATDTSRGIAVPPHRRPVRWAAQRPALFPNMTVRRNLRFAVPLPGAEGDSVVESALARFKLAAIADRRPSALSGGEQQRVSLARAAVWAGDKLLLLDEPFTGLDSPLRDDLLEGLRGWLSERGTPVLSVTHDVGEAFLLEAEVVRLHEGRVLQQGPVMEVLAAERSRLLTQVNGHA